MILELYVPDYSLGDSCLLLFTRIILLKVKYFCQHCSCFLFSHTSLQINAVWLGRQPLARSSSCLNKQKEISTFKVCLVEHEVGRRAVSGSCSSQGGRSYEGGLWARSFFLDKLFQNLWEICSEKLLLLNHDMYCST